MPLSVYNGCVYFSLRDKIVVPGVKGGPVQDESGRGGCVEFWEKEGYSDRDTLMVREEIFFICGVHEEMRNIGG